MFKNKYLKYKNKYINIKNLQIGCGYKDDIDKNNFIKINKGNEIMNIIFPCILRIYKYDKESNNFILNLDLTINTLNELLQNQTFKDYLNNNNELFIEEEVTNDYIIIYKKF